MKYAFLALAAILMVSTAYADPTPAQSSVKSSDPSVAQVEAVLGPQIPVERTGPGEYVVDGEHVTLAQLLATILAQKEEALKTMQENIRQRQSTAAEAASGMSLDAKRAQCQKLPTGGVDRTRCYQELEDLRDAQTQSASDAADRQKDDQLQSDRLQQEIDAIEQFKKQFAPAPAK